MVESRTRLELRVGSGSIKRINFAASIFNAVQLHTHVALELLLEAVLLFGGAEGNDRRGELVILLEERFGTLS